MRINLRLTDRDLDLALLFSNMRVVDIVRKVVRAYISGEQFVLHPPVTFTNVKLNMRQFKLDEQADADVIEWLEHIKRGYVSNVLKILIRHAISVPYIVPFMDGEEMAVTSQPGVPVPVSTVKDLSSATKSEKTKRGSVPQRTESQEPAKVDKTNQKTTVEDKEERPKPSGPVSPLDII
jgi:hypothetical protein